MADTEAQIAAQGEKIRQLKASKAAKEAIEPEVKVLLALKAKYKVHHTVSLCYLDLKSRFIDKNPDPCFMMSQAQNYFFFTLKI